MCADKKEMNNYFATIFHLLENTQIYLHLKYNLNNQLFHFFSKNVLLGKSKLLVGELACGTGYGSHLLAKHKSVAYSFAVDIAPNLHERACIRDFSAIYINADLFHMPFRRESLDFVWNSSSIEHFDDPLSAIREMASVIKKGGYIFVGVPYLSGPMLLYYIMPFRRHRDWLGRPYSMIQVKNMLLQSGLYPEEEIVYFYRFFVGVLARKI